MSKQIHQSVCVQFADNFLKKSIHIGDNPAEAAFLIFDTHYQYNSVELAMYIIGKYDLAMNCLGVNFKDMNKRAELIIFLSKRKTPYEVIVSNLNFNDVDPILNPKSSFTTSLLIMLHLKKKKNPLSFLNASKRLTLIECDFPKEAIALADNVKVMVMMPKEYYSNRRFPEPLPHLPRLESFELNLNLVQNWFETVPISLVHVKHVTIKGELTNFGTNIELFTKKNIMRDLISLTVITNREFTVSIL